MEATERMGIRRLLTPFNLVATIILAMGAYLTYNRFFHGIGASSNLSQDYPWGIWIGFDVVTGVALAAGGFIIGSAVHIFGLKDYRPIVRPAILTGFLGYFFVVVGLTFDLGRPWRLPYPLFVSYGVTSMMFEVGWCVALYLTCQFIELLPALFERLGWKRWRTVAMKIMLGATIFGVILSTTHQSALGGLFVMAPAKIHPLWYSPYIPLFFFVSAVAGGLSMIIFESAMAHRLFRDKVGIDAATLDRLTIGLAKASSMTLAAYFAIKVIGVAYANQWALLNTLYGHWYLVELIGFVFAPGFLFAVSVRNRNARLARSAALITILGVLLNRLNISIFAFNYHLPSAQRYIPDWKEIGVSVFVVTLGLISYRWIVNRLPILFEHPDYKSAHAPAGSTGE